MTPDEILVALLAFCVLAGAGSLIAVIGAEIRETRRTRR